MSGDGGDEVARRGDAAWEQGDMAAAIALYREALDAGVDDVALRLGNLLAEAGDVAAAEAAYRHAIDRGEPMGWRNLALTVQDDDPEAAVTYYRAAVDAGDQRSSYLLGEHLADLGRPDEAIAALSQALAEGEGEAAITLGLLHKERRDLNEAERVFRQGTELLPADLAAYLGLLLRETGRVAEEVALYRSVLDEHPDAVDVLINLANVLSEDEPDDAEAERLYRRAIDLGSVEACTNLGITLHEAGRHAEALAWLRRAADAGDDLARRWLDPDS